MQSLLLCNPVGGKLAPMLLHLYSKEVGADFCCLILQLIANRMSIALQHTARTFSASMQTQTSQSFNGTFKELNADEEIDQDFSFFQLRIIYFTYNISSY